MLSIQLRIAEQNYSSPAKYWISHLESQSHSASTEAKIEITHRTLNGRRRTRMRQLRYTQSHGLFTRTFHRIMAMFGYTPHLMTVRPAH